MVKKRKKKYIKIQLPPKKEEEPMSSKLAWKQKNDNAFLFYIGFIIFIFYYNFQIFIKSDDNGKFLLILFFFYFWGSSLVNFSFWLGWWQVSYFFITALISSINLSKNKNNGLAGGK